MSSSTTPGLRTKEERDRLVEQVLPLVRHVVARLPVAMPATLDRDDFYSVGVMGLMHAAVAYDPNRGASFKTFAYTAIRGAILDEIRRHDPVPRGRRDRLRQMDRATGALHARLGRAPTLEELGDELGLCPQDLDQDLLAQHTCRLLSLDDSMPDADGGPTSHAANVADRDPTTPADRAVQNEQVDRLAQAIGELPEPDRQVVVLYHFENLYLKEIGDILGVTESRVSQVLTRATQRLRLKMKDVAPES